jgi:hypothetical protein
MRPKSDRLLAGRSITCNFGGSWHPVRAALHWPDFQGGRGNLVHRLPEEGREPAHGGLDDFAQYADGWWEWGRYPYIKGRLARGFNISRGYAAVRSSYLKQYVLLEFGSVMLTGITLRMTCPW